MELFLNAEKLAERLGVPIGTVYYWKSRGTIPYRKFGKHLRFSEMEVLEHFAKQTAAQRFRCRGGSRGLPIKHSSRSLKTEDVRSVDLRMED